MKIIMWVCDTHMGNTKKNENYAFTHLGTNFCFAGFPFGLSREDVQCFR